MVRDCIAESFEVSFMPVMEEMLDAAGVDAAPGDEAARYAGDDEAGDEVASEEEDTQSFNARFMHKMEDTRDAEGVHAERDEDAASDNSSSSQTVRDPGGVFLRSSESLWMRDGL